jgi:hypothetical protein
MLHVSGSPVNIEAAKIRDLLACCAARLLTQLCQLLDTVYHVHRKRTVACVDTCTAWNNLLQGRRRGILATMKRPKQQLRQPRSPGLSSTARMQYVQPRGLWVQYTAEYKGCRSQLDLTAINQQSCRSV